MDILTNHCWCSDSNWGGGHYNCRVIVSIHLVQEGKTYYDPHEPDWLNLVEEHPFTPNNKEPFSHRTHRLKPEVMEWLRNNVKDRTNDKDHKQGWCVGTDTYNATTTISFPIFFESSRDALRFIKRWSSHKKPVNYLNYFTDNRRKLNFETNRLQRIPR